MTNGIDPLKDGNIKNKMGIIGYTDRRQRFYKYNPETPTVHPSLAPIPIVGKPEPIKIIIRPPAPTQSTPTITKPTRQRQQQRPKPQQPTKTKPNKSNKGAGIIGAILLLLIIIMIVAHAINLHYNMQDVKYFQDKVDLQQQIIDNLQSVNFLYHSYYYYVSNNVLLLLLLHSEEVSN